MATSTHTCPRCGDAFKRKENLVLHLRRKNECPTKNENTPRATLLKTLTEKKYNDKTYNCEFCGKKFNLSSCKSRHRKTCKKRNDNNLEDSNTSTSNTTDLNTATTNNPASNVSKAEFELMVKKMKEMEARLDAYTKAGGTVNNINNGTNYTTNININLNNFGQESTNHLTNEFLSHCIFNPTKGISSLIETIHYNKDIPENHNLRCRSLKQNLFEKFVDSEWRTCDASNTLDELIRKGYRILNSYYTEHLMNDPEINENESKIRALERFRFLGDKTCNDYYAIKRELRVLVKDRTAYVLASPEAENLENANEIEDNSVGNAIINE